MRVITWPRPYRGTNCPTFAAGCFTCGHGMRRKIFSENAPNPQNTKNKNKVRESGHSPAAVERVEDEATAVARV